MCSLPTWLSSGYIQFKSFSRISFVSGLLPLIRLKTPTKQEYIPVGCILPAAVAICWGCLPQCMLGYTPQGLGLDTPPVWPWRPTSWPNPPTSTWCGSGDPPGQTSHSPGYGPGDPPGQTPHSPQVWAWRPPCEQNPWHKLLKILPYPNFVAGSKNKRYQQTDYSH